MTATTISEAARAIVNRRALVPAEQSLLAAVSGIDGCGKGYIAAALHAELSRRGFVVALINIDGWLNLPQVRFSKSKPATHFYEQGLRFDEMFEQLVLPLKMRRSCRIEMDFAEETATVYRKQLVEFRNVDIALVEGIYLLKRPFQARYDISFWVDCSFDTALERAIARAQEGLPPDQTVRAYQTIYFPAQRIHFRRDRPQLAATHIIANDPRLTRGNGAAAAPKAFEFQKR